MTVEKIASRDVRPDERRSRYGPAAAGLHIGSLHVGIVILGLVLTAATLLAMGRPWWCESGDARLWSGDIWSRHNSQHLADPYTITHALHGIWLYGFLWVLRDFVGPVARAAAALGLEAAWEVIENTDTVIERYRAATISLDYYGDSVTNSVGDVVAFLLGYIGATWMPAWLSAVTFFAVDATLVLWVRDSLLLNVLMLFYPIESVKAWQMAGRIG
jgi:hypothetical protein